ncbi:18807_t:CDS:1 [Acaulospora morrowiae]|uniref:18807_t:CDS:1 n=1 Tax=Acaulospora morrowiae TaxID=94023 RepID=A0A9N8YMX1_9GLOM|nr:18807_t:CDS:1 [Acaulospora morrowiae]
MSSHGSRCVSCNEKRILKHGNGDLCTNCYSARFHYVNSGNRDIDDLIKATHKNNPKFRLEWIPFEDFTDVQRIGEGGFGHVFTAMWTKGKIESWNSVSEEFNRASPETVALKMLKNSKEINTEFLNEVTEILIKSDRQYIL